MMDANINTYEARTLAIKLAVAHTLVKSGNGEIGERAQAWTQGVKDGRGVIRKNESFERDCQQGTMRTALACFDGGDTRHDGIAVPSNAKRVPDTPEDKMLP